MTFKVNVEKAAIKGLASLSSQDRKKVMKSDFLTLLENPYNLPANMDVKKLQTYDHAYRIRIGDYRIVYLLDKKNSQVHVLAVDDRGDAYKDDSIRTKEKQLFASYDGLENSYGPSVYQRPLPSELRPPLEPTQLVKAIVEDVPGLAPYLEHIPVHFSGGPKNDNAVYLTNDFMDLTLDEQNFDFAEAVGLVYLNQKGGIHALLEEGRQNQVDMWNPEDLLFGEEDSKACFAKCFAVYMLDEAALYELSPKWFEIVEALV